MAIRKSRELSALLGKPEDITLCTCQRCDCRLTNLTLPQANGGTALHSPVFQLLPADMRLPPSETMNALLALPGVDGRPLLSPSLPTLLLFECVLVYMSPEASAALMQWFVDYFAAAEEGSVLGGVVYEMFGLNDPFGKVMLNNLKVTNPHQHFYIAAQLCCITGPKCSASRCRTLRRYQISTSEVSSTWV